MSKVVCLWKIPNKDVEGEADPYGELDIYPRGELLGIYQSEEAAVRDREWINNERSDLYSGEEKRPWTMMIDFQHIIDSDDVSTRGKSYNDGEAIKE